MSNVNRVPKARKDREDHVVVGAFVDYLRKHGYPDLVVDKWPDEENRNSSDIDAIAGEFAIEHTSVDTLEQQRRDSQKFIKIVEPLEVMFKNSLPYRLEIVFPYHGIAEGQDWEEIRRALEAWVSEGSPHIPEGRHRIRLPVAPFEIGIDKATDRTPGLVFFRTEPHDGSLPSRCFDQFQRKAGKLGRYRDLGKTTVLLIESNDIALINPLKMLNAVRLAFPNGLPRGVDRLWYVDTSIQPASKFVFDDFTNRISG